MLLHGHLPHQSAFTLISFTTPLIAAVVAGQILIVEVGGAAFQVTRLAGRDWAISLIIGALSLPLGVLVRLVPSEPIERFLIKIRVFPDPDKLPTVTPEMENQYSYNPALDKVSAWFGTKVRLNRVSQVKDNLRTYANIRGGRLRASSIVAKSRSRRLSEADVQLYAPSLPPKARAILIVIRPSLLAMIPTLIAGTVG